MKFFFAVLLAALLGLAPAAAQLNEIGLAPLRQEIGARPQGMGGAFAGLSDDMNAAFYNPAGLAWVKGVSLTFKDLDNLAVAQAYPLGNNSALGLNLIRSRLSGIPVSGGTASASSNIVYLSYGTKLSFLPQYYYDPNFQKLALGLNVKGLFDEKFQREGALDRTAAGWDLDLGVLYKGAEWWSAGLVLENILPDGAFSGGQINWNVGTPESLPALGRLAGSARIIGDVYSPIFIEDRELVLAGEINFAEARPLTWRLGSEWMFEKNYYIRGGLMQQDQGAGVVTDINLGFGWRSGRLGLDVALFREAVSSEKKIFFSIVNLMEDWVVTEKLEVEHPRIVLETAIEGITLTDNIVTYDDRIVVAGKVKPGVEVSINGALALVDSQSMFNVVVPLKLKKNLVLVEASYKGEKKNWKYKVLRQVKIEIAEQKAIEEKLKQAADEGERRKLQAEAKQVEAQKQQVEALVTMGVVEVSAEASFELNAGVTRGELSVWLVRASELPLPKVSKDLFPDVPKDHDLAPYIQVMAELDILQPFPNGTFRPEAIVSKAEGDAIFARFGAAP